MIRLLVVDDHRVVRTGLKQLVETFSDVELVASAANGEDAVAACAKLQPDVALVDLSMPGMDGIEVTHMISEQSPVTRVVVFTSFSDRDRILQALDAGAIGYLLKDAEPDELHRGILAAARGEAPLDPKAAVELLAARAARRPAEELTAREREILVLLASGMTNMQIGRRLGISVKTVKGHVTHLFQRLGVQDRTQATLWAERRGLL
jgi:DNA-binding NarL/FixJ family response regulator